MEENLVSKKDLLEITGISYGQLYRWKRKGLIPEEWFIKKSSFTGQETFFPKVKVLERIEKIKSLKDDVSLDELSKKITGNVMEKNIECSVITKENIVTTNTLNIFFNEYGKSQTLTFNEVFQISLFHNMLSSGNVNVNEGFETINMVRTHIDSIKIEDYKLLLIRKLGIFMCEFVPDYGEVILDSNAKVLWECNIKEITEKLRLVLLNIKGGIF